MELNKLKSAGGRHHEVVDIPDITKEEILAAIESDLTRFDHRLLYNTFLFSLLIIFCQAC